MAETNVELARRGYEAVLRGDFDAVSEFLDPEVRWHGGDPSAQDACNTREQALGFMRRARNRRGVGELVEIIDAGDKVVVVMRPRSDGNSEASLVANLTTFRDGKAIEMVHYPTPEAALLAAGV